MAITSQVAPNYPFRGQVWIDNSSVPFVRKIYDGTTWQDVGIILDSIEPEDGDITSISVSDPLTGGGAVGDITIGLDQSKLNIPDEFELPTGEPNEVLKRDGGNELVFGKVSQANIEDDTITEEKLSPLLLDKIEHIADGGLTQSAADGRYLQLSGGTLTGNLTLSGNPSSALDAATKSYVDAITRPNLDADVVLDLAKASRSSADRGRLVAVSSTSEDSLALIDAPEGLPSGGALNQILSKKSATDFDVEWVNLPTPGTGVNLNDDAILDLVKQTRTTADRGKVLATDPTNENALTFLDHVPLNANADEVLTYGSDGKFITRKIKAGNVDDGAITTTAIGAAQITGPKVASQAISQSKLTTALQSRILPQTIGSNGEVLSVVSGDVAWSAVSYIDLTNKPTIPTISTGDSQAGNSNIGSITINGTGYNFQDTQGRSLIDGNTHLASGIQTRLGLLTADIVSLTPSTGWAPASSDALGGISLNASILNIAAADDLTYTRAKTNTSNENQYIYIRIRKDDNRRQARIQQLNSNNITFNSTLNEFEYIGFSGSFDYFRSSLPVGTLSTSVELQVIGEDANIGTTSFGGVLVGEAGKDTVDLNSLKSDVENRLLPSPSGNAGKFMKVNSEDNGYEITDPPTIDEAEIANINHHIDNIENITHNLIAGDPITETWRQVNADGSEGGVAVDDDRITLTTAKSETYDEVITSALGDYYVIRIPLGADVRKYRYKMLYTVGYFTDTHQVSRLTLLGKDDNWEYHYNGINPTAVIKYTLEYNPTFDESSNTIARIAYESGLG
ncbi:MAG: hypothetical protein F4026_07980 [Synechococcus sp. SB0669_bin_8]|nr:hypothetical protein [Synechococcus sp. SB0675_bin_6]MYJ60600.1 hypothetical protein [Synechococcus sp. SB0672_bin_6]MYK92056.1 hypothetical protein [Synechococcus sp. SB0669_bin_8]